jgi:hypothetical protein
MSAEKYIRQLALFRGLVDDTKSLQISQDESAFYKTLTWVKQITSKDYEATLNTQGIQLHKTSTCAKTDFSGGKMARNRFALGRGAEFKSCGRTSRRD